MKFEEFKEVYKPKEIIKLAGEIENYDGSIKDFVAKATSKRSTGTLLRGIVKALMLFTGGNVASVRNPDSFNAEQSEKFDLSKVAKILGNYSDKSPTKDDYQISNYVLELLAQSDAKKPWHATQELYRGMNRLSANAFLALCKPGAVYSLGKIVSTSVDKNVAYGFIKKAPKYKLVYILDNSKVKKGIYTADRTSSWSHEQEVVLGGRIKILKFEIKPTYEDINPFEYSGPWESGTITDFDKLMEYVQVMENFNSNKNAEIGGMTVYAEVLP